LRVGRRTNLVIPISARPAKFPSCRTLRRSSKSWKRTRRSRASLNNSSVRGDTHQHVQKFAPSTRSFWPSKSWTSTIHTAIPWRLAATSPPSTDRLATRTEGGTGHAGSVPWETKVIQRSAPTPNAPYVASSRPLSIWLTSGRRPAGGGSVQEFTRPQRLPKQTITPPPTLRHH